MATVRLENVVKHYPLGKTFVPALRGVTLRIDEGEFAALAGASGSGKSTLLNLIGCLDKATQGEVWVGDALVNNMSEKELNRLRLHTIGFIFQSYNLIPVLSVVENVELPLLIHAGVSAAERKARVDHFIEAVGLADQRNKKPAELSGGQRQRVAVARALVTKPHIVLADEPTANLDSKTGMEIIDLMHEINRREKTTFLFSTHDPKIIERAGRIIHIQDGLVKSEG
jgi:putative ABC transport system ATP-binding protein